MMRTLLFAALALAATAPTAHADPAAYQAAALAHYGYSDMQLDAAHPSIGFASNEDPSRETAQDYLFHRGAEVKLIRGFEHLIVVDHNIDVQREMLSIGQHLPLIAPRRYREIVRYTATPDIKIRRGEQPPYASNIYDARDVQSNLVWRIHHAF